MERKALNASGCLGTLYDGYRDRVIDRRVMNVQGQGIDLSGSPQCQLIRGSMDVSRNLLQSIGIQDEQRLSLLLGLTKRSGVAEVLNYSHHINQYTRFLYYSWISRKEQSTRKEVQVPESTEVSDLQTSATHIITSISFGIDVLVVLQLPSKTTRINKIDLILEKICSILLSGKINIEELSSDKKELLEKIRHTTVYSNIPSLTELAKVGDISHQIHELKRNPYLCRPLTYSFQPITSSCSLHTGKAVTFSLLPSKLKDDLEEHLAQFKIKIKNLEVSLHENIPRLLCENLKHRLTSAQSQYSVAAGYYMDERELFAKLVVDIRSDQVKASEKMSQALHNDAQITLQNSIDELIRDVNDLETKGRLITDLLQHRFEYWNAAELNLDEGGNIRSIERLLISKDRRNRGLCSNDTLNKNNPSKLADRCQMLVEKLKNNTELRLIYVDFSYCSFQLHDMMIFPSNEADHSKNQVKQKAPSPTNVLQTASALSPTPLPSRPINETINILLVGEAGVGKSTFINAFANYLTFDSLEQAKSNEPMVLTPISFIRTTGNNFDEHTIKFGKYDSANNKDFNTAGQSVTQHCKSYLFNLNHTDGKKLRIIDTPGFGDTRGLDQDERNMELILQYVNNLTHLNAICFLLKPNATRLSIFFRTCLTQLFSLLGTNARENILFCFTNARSTFYSPGNTASLLKTMLESLSISGIPFKKDNTFCFDNESFRFLVVLQNDIWFTDDAHRKYKMSWSRSVKESNRLVSYIRKELSVYRFEDNWQSIKHAQFEISHRIRPMLQAMRNILRNIILCKMNLTNEFIELSSIALHRPATRCLSCKPFPRLKGKFWVIPDLPHEIQNQCLICACSVDQHVPIDYTLEYAYQRSMSSDHHQNEMNDILDALCHASAHFAYFLMHTACSTKDDPFLIGLVEMIMEENDLCKSQKPNQFNYQLSKDLTQTQILYEQRMSKLMLNHQSTELPVICKLVRSISEYPMVREQLAAVKRTQQMIMEQYEYEANKI